MTNVSLSMTPRFNLEVDRDQLMFICDALSTEIEQTKLSISLHENRGLGDSISCKFLVRTIETLKSMREKLLEQQ